MTELTVSQALRKIKKLKGLLAEHLLHASQSVSFETRKPPAFAFSAALEAAGTTRQELIALETRLAVTNAVTSFDFEGKKLTLSGATRQLQELKSQIAWIRALPVLAQANTTTEESEYDSVVEKYVKKVTEHTCCLPEAQRVAQAQLYQDAFDRLNDAVETTNHRTSLVTL